MATILESKKDFATQPITDNERELIHSLRTLLKDLPDDVFRSLNTLVEEQRGERWTDSMLLVYLNYAVSDINTEPILTGYTLEDYPSAWKACILNGAMIFALIAEGILQNGEQFSYSDNGISLSINLAQGYQSMAQMLLTRYDEMKKGLKRYLRPQAASIKSNPAPVRVRSYAPRQWVYR